jgi:hypothetical protein
VPVHVLAHKLDARDATTPENSEILHNDFISAGVNSRFDEVTGGFTLSQNPCQALTYHEFLGIENEAVKKMIERMDEILKAIKKNGFSTFNPTFISVMVIPPVHDLVYQSTGGPFSSITQKYRC